MCTLCHRVFSLSRTLRDHALTHTGEKPYHCELCNKVFSRKNSLESHKKVHTGIKPYKCNLCQNDFAWRGGLTIHMRTHTGERPYTCDFCDKAFTQSSSLKCHVKRHARETLYKRDLYQNVKLSITESPFENTSHVRFSTSAESGSFVEGKVSSIIETTEELSIQQNFKPSPDLKQPSGDHCAINTGVKPFVSRLCGCAICDEIFEIEKEFIEHCYHHFTVAQNDTFSDLCRHLASCSCGEATRLFC